MNSRGVYQEIRESWKTEQTDQVIPFAQQAWRWKIQQLMERKDGLSKKDDAFRCEIKPNRWPYVNPYQEAQADGMQLENRTTNRDIICDRQGYEFDDVEKQRQTEDKKIPVKVEDKGKK